MPATTPPQDPNYSDHSDFDDRESLFFYRNRRRRRPPSREIAEITSKNGISRYLVQRKNCLVLRSSWEGRETFNRSEQPLEDWDKETQRQTKGKSTSLDVAAFNKKVLETELAERRRRISRRLRRSVNRVLSIVSA